MANLPPIVTDPSDFLLLPAPLPSLSPLDSSLRCLVCKDFFTTPMMTSCSHTFCSLCIRRCLSTDGKCPACRGPEQEVKLRRNWAVQDIVDGWVGARDGWLALGSEVVRLREGAREYGEGSKRGVKRKRNGDEVVEGGEEVDGSRLEAEGGGKRTTRSRSRREATGMVDTTEVIQIEDDLIGDVVMIVDDERNGDGDDEYQPDDGKVPCPMCGRRMKEDAVYLHLDSCETEQQSRTLPATISHAPPPKPAQPSPTPLPKLNYSLLKETALRKKLGELGIRASGNKPLLERRHQEWVSIWNANCDSLRPRSRRELLQDLDTWERSQGGLAPGTISMSLGGGVMRKDFDGKAWADGHADDFRDLIAKARAKGKVEEKRAEDQAHSSERVSNHQAIVATPPTDHVVSVNNPTTPDINTAGLSFSTGDPSDPIIDPCDHETSLAEHPRPAPLSSPVPSSNGTIYPPTTPSRFLSSPAKPRMFAIADDPIVESDGVTDVGRVPVR